MLNKVNCLDCKHCFYDLDMECFDCRKDHWVTVEGLVNILDKECEDFEKSTGSYID